MLKNVLIIDDEKIIRQGIRLSVPWEELGFKVIGEAETAMEALEKLDTCDIDLVLVDVQMPGMDGIEFIQEMRKNYPHLKVLIISGHSNFEYIASALKLQVSDYLLKPINILKLLDTLKNIRAQIDKEEQEISVSREQRNIAGKMLAMRLIGRDFRNREEIDSYCNRCGIAYPLENYCVVSMKTNQFMSVLENIFSGQAQEFEKRFEDAMRAAIDEDMLFASLIGNYYAVVVKKEAVETVQNTLYREAQRIGMQITIGTGQVFENIYFMNISYLQANEMIDKKTRVVQSKEKALENRMTYLSEVLIQELEERNFEKVEGIVNEVFTDNFSVEPGKVLNWCIRSLCDIVEYFQLASYPEMEGITVVELQTISTLYFYVTLRTVYMKKIQKICRFLKDLKGNSNEAIVDKICGIVKKEYMDPELSLQDIAQRMNISYNYLSTVFKQINGKNFSAYLIDVKMSRAKQMVLEGSLKMYEIAEKVGYSNAKYFTEQFKKTVGMTPSEYKSSHNRSQKEV